MPSKSDLSLGAGVEISPLEWMIRKLESIGTVADEDKAAILAITGATPKELAPYEDVVREGDRPNHVCMVLTGMLCRYKFVSDGERQILSWHPAGDVPDAQSLFIERMDHSLGTLTAASILLIPHATMLQLFEQRRTIGYLFWRSTLIDAAIFREWMVGLGRRDAKSRLAHMFCEIVTLMRAVGLTSGNTCHLPLTQSEIADAAGMSTVHVNRSLQDMRKKGLITFQGGSLEVLDWDGLAALGDFDPAYLHLKSAA